MVRIYIYIYINIYRLALYIVRFSKACRQLPPNFPVIEYSNEGFHLNSLSASYNRRENGNVRDWGQTVTNTMSGAD